jgi:hypothetical protein
MKKLFVSVLLLTALGSKAQVSQIEFTSADTLTNADTIVKNITISNSTEAILLQPVITRLSGTAAGKVVLLQSVDGTTFIRTDSITLSNVVTNTAFISKVSPVAPYYRIEFISSGTTALIPRLWYYQRKNK